MSVDGTGRFSVTVERELLEEFERVWRAEGYRTRSGAVSDILRDWVFTRTVLKGRRITGTLTVVYEHNRREILRKLISIGHENKHLAVSSMHIHLTHERCLEVIVVKGRASEIRSYLQRIRNARGVISAGFTPAAGAEEEKRGDKNAHS